MNSWNSIEEVAREFGLSASSSDIPAVLGELRKRLADSHPDRNGGEFPTPSAKDEFMRVQAAVEFAEEHKHAGAALVPVSQVTALIEAVSQALSRRDQAIEISSGPTRLQIVSDIHSRLRKTYRGPKITSGSLLAVSSALFAFMGSLEKHPVLGIYLQNHLFVSTLIYAWLASGILFLWLWYREGLVEAQAEFLLSDQALSEVFPLLCHHAAHQSEKNGAFRIDQLASINARWWRLGRSRYLYYRMGPFSWSLSAYRRLTRLLRGGTVDFAVAQKVAREQVAKLLDRRAVKKIEDPDIAEWYQIDQALLSRYSERDAPNPAAQADG